MIHARLLRPEISKICASPYTLDAVIARRYSEIRRILTSFAVPLL